MFRYSKSLLSHRNVFMQGYCSICSSFLLKSKSQTNLVKKFLLQTTSDKKRRKWHENDFAVPSTPGTGTSKKNPAKNFRRSKNLSKVLLDKISDIMSTGEMATELYGLGLELSEVRVLPDMQEINVLWICTGTEADEQIEALLAKNVGAIRHDLSQQRLLGHVPYITFVKDERFHKLMEVEKLLGVADYGPDFVPSDATHHTKVSVLNMTLDSSVKEALNIVDVQDPFDEALKIFADGESLYGHHDTAILPSDLPPMKHDVLGVDTKKLYEQVQLTMRKARADHRRVELSEAASSLPAQCSASDHGRVTPQDIRQWATKYKHMRRKKLQLISTDEALLEDSSFESYAEEGQIEFLEEEEDYMEDMDIENSQEYKPFQ